MRKVLKIYDVHYNVAYFKYFTNERFMRFARTKRIGLAKVFSDEKEMKELHSNLIHMRKDYSYVWIDV